MNICAFNIDNFLKNSSASLFNSVSVIIPVLDAIKNLFWYNFGSFANDPEDFSEAVDCNIVNFAKIVLVSAADVAKILRGFWRLFPASITPFLFSP